MVFEPKVNEIYKHFKGNLYKVTALAEHTETGETLVVYEAMYGEHKTYARPLEMFTSKVDKEKYPDIVQEYRFELVEQEVPHQEEAELDPLVEEFLDTDTYEGRLNILEALHHRITDDMLATMAIVCDVELEGESTEDRFQSLKSCILTWIKYEGHRI